MTDKNFDVATYLDHLIYNWLQTNYFPGLLFTTQDLMSIRQAVMSGLALPATVMYRTSPPIIEEERYGKSVIKRLAMYQGDMVTVQLIDYLVRYSFFSASYLLQPLNETYQQVTNLDIDRYFEFDLSAIIPPSSRTKVEFRKTSQDFKPELLEDQAQRKLATQVDWELRITLPVIDSPIFIEQVRLFINGTQFATIGTLT